MPGLLRAPGLLGAVVVGLVVFAIYALGACRTIYVGDSGELVTAVHILGIPHPSGYPLYVLLGKLWTVLVPIGHVSFRMSLFSAACAASACAVLYGLGLNLSLRREAAAFGAAMLAVAPSFWAEANIQRVYALNALFVVLVTAAVWRWCESGKLRALALAFFLCGLGATNHTFMAIHAAALGVFVVAADPAIVRRRPGALSAAMACFLPGLLPYLYLPLRSRADPALDWGNPETLHAFLKVVLRLDFWERRWLETPADLLVIFADYARSLGTELAWVGTFLAGLGAVAWLLGRVFGVGDISGRTPDSDGSSADERSESIPFEPPGSGEVTSSIDGAAQLRTPDAMSNVDRSVRGEGRRCRFVLLPLLVMASNLAALALHGSRTDIFIWHRYYIPSYLMAALLSAIGCEAVLARLPRRLGPLALALPVVLLISGWREHDRSRYRIGEDLSSLVLDSLTPGAHLIAEDDNILFTLIYLHFVEGRRPDVDLILQGVGSARLPPLKFDPKSDPLFFTHHPNWDLPGLEIVPLGVVFRAWRAGQPAPEPVIRKLELEGESDPRVPKDYLTQNLIGHFHYMLGITFEGSDWMRAREEFRRATSASPHNDVLFYNLGLIYRRNGLLDEALEAFRRSDAINPRHLANRQRPRAADVGSSRVDLQACKLEYSIVSPK